MLRTACTDSISFQRLEPLVSAIDLPAWFEQVDESSFSLADWVEALLAFDGWLSDERVETRPVESMIGYIHCCTLTMAETLSPPNLASLTREMLEQHGFDAAQDVDSTA